LHLVTGGGGVDRGEKNDRDGDEDAAKVSAHGSFAGLENFAQMGVLSQK